MKLRLLAGVAVWTLVAAGWAAEPAADDPYWMLIHDRAVIDDLKLAPDRRRTLEAALDPLDLRCLTLRNKPAAEANGGFVQIVAESRRIAAPAIGPDKSERLAQIVARAQGTDALLREDVERRLKLVDSQRKRIREAISATREAKVRLQRELREAKTDVAAAERELQRVRSAELAAVNELLTNEQKIRWRQFVGDDFDLAKLGDTAFKAPPLTGDKENWLQSPPLGEDALRGKVVVVHFFAFGCSNCIHNYPTYREWQTAFAGRDVQLVGVHTPETKGEHNVERLQAKLAEERLMFPVLVDNDRRNWNAWGNSMWPSVYVIDRRGYLRSFWAGELKWQGATGDAQLRQKIESLLAETALPYQ